MAFFRAFVRSFATHLRSVRLRLTLWNVAVLGLALMMTGTFLRQSVSRSLRAGIDHDLLTNCARFQAFWPLHNHPPSLQGHMPPGPDIHGDFGHPRVVDVRGMDYLSHQPEPVLDRGAVYDCLQREEQVFTIVRLGKSREPFRVLTSPMLRLTGEHGPRYVVQTAASLGEEEHELTLLTRGLLAVIPLALLTAGLGAAFLTDRALRPVRSVALAASGVGAAQDLSARLPVVGNDEFTHLASTFNGMMTRLEGAFLDMERAYEQQRRFVADASHELRTPLTIIKANTSLALLDADTDPDMRETLTEIDRGVDRTSRIVQDLFLLARSDSGQLPMNRRSVDLGDLLLRVCAQMRLLSASESGGIQVGAPILFQAPTEPDVNAPLLLQGDADHLERLFHNLLENAVRHTPLTGSIRVATRLKGGNVVVDIADDGEGIAPEHLPRLMERFYRVDSARARTEGGTGLGLAICAAIAHAHGGSLTIESVLHRGTTVQVTLPETYPPTTCYDTPQGDQE